MSNPRIGQRATFFPGGGLPHRSAVVDHVWGDHCVNLLLDEPVQPGGATLMTSVLVYGPDTQGKPSGYYCTLFDGRERLVRDPQGNVQIVRVDATESRDERVAAPAPVTAAIKGYRQLTPADQALINECKELAEQCGAMVARLRAMQPSPPSGPTLAAPSETDPLGQNTTIDHRWVSIGATQLQQGWMAVIRGIAQPSTF